MTDLAALYATLAVAFLLMFGMPWALVALAIVATVIVAAIYAGEAP